jgi:ATP:ADP antiporter, AAA family
MFTLLGLIIATSYILKPVRSALFLSQLGAERLPYVYILVAVVLGLVAAAFARFAPRFDLSRLLVSVSCLFALSLVVFWLAVLSGWRWTGYVFYVWVSIFTALMPSLFWLLANYVFYSNEGRRLFSIVTAGGLLGSILGGALTSLLATRVGTAGLLLVAAVVLSAIAALVRLTTVRERDRIRERRSDLERQERVRASSRREHPWRIITASRYLTMLTALVLLATLASTLLDYQFNTVVERSFASRDELTRFFGSFFAFISVIAFFLQLFLAGRILSRLGVISGLALLPIALLTSSLGFLFRPSLLTAALLKTADDGLGNSINRASIEVLYLPVALAVKNRIKTWVDLFVERMSRGLAGLVILGATALSVSVSQLSLVLLAILVPWVALVHSLRRAYVETFRESLARRDITDLATALADPASLHVFHQLLANGEDPRQTAYALELLQGVEDPVLLEDARKLTSHENPLVRAAALRALGGSSSPPPLDDFERSIGDEDPVAAAEALALWMRVDPEAGAKTLARWVDTGGADRIASLLDCLDGRKELVSTDVIARILDRHGRSDAASCRRLAAKAIGFLPESAESSLRDPLLAELIELVEDPDVEVARAAVRSAGKLRARETLPELVKGLARRPLRAEARMAIARFGEEGLNELTTLLEDEALPIDMRLSLPRAIAEIDEPRAVLALFRILPASDLRLHYQAIKGLSRLRARSASLRFPRAAVDGLLDHERGLVLDHSRSLTALKRSPRGRDSDGSFELLISVLEERVEFARERIFRVLGLVYPQREMAGVWSRLAYAEPGVRATALEYLANVLSSRDRRSLLPLVESGNDPDRRPSSKTSEDGWPPPLEQVLPGLMRSGDDWLAACAVTVAGRLRLVSLAPLFERARDHSSALVREAASRALLSLGAGGSDSPPPAPPPFHPGAPRN